jgi:hypothetical protein
MGAMPALAQYATKAGASAGGSGLRLHAVGLSLKICRALAPIYLARLAAGNRPLATPRWIPTRGAPGGQVSRRRGSGRATVRGMDHGREERPATLDLLTIGLLVFFLALIGIVAALLILPTLHS